MTTEPPLLPLPTFSPLPSGGFSLNSLPSGGRAARFPPPVIPPGALSYGDFPMTRSSTLLPEGMLISAVREL